MAPDLALLDVNVLIALAWPQHVHHGRAHTWFGACETWATTPLTETAFVRLCTNPVVVGRRVSFAEAVKTLAAMRGLEGHRFVSDDASLASPVISLGRVATSRQVTDAHLVELAARSDAVLATLDARILEMLEPSDRSHVLLIPDSPEG